jgi:oligopeptide transport system substrate-binding protein
MKKKLGFLILVTILSLILMIPACRGGASAPAPAPTPAPSQQIPEYLRLVGPDPVTIDPHRVTDIGSHTYVGKLFSGLLKMDLAAVDKNYDGDFDDQGEILGLYTQEDIQKILEVEYPQGLAFTYDFMMRNKPARGLSHVKADIAKEIPKPVYNEDGTISYIFKLRDNVKFRNNREVTAWDFAYSFDRAADPELVSSTAELYLGDILGVWEMLYGREYQGKKMVNRVYQFKPGEDFDISKVIVDLPGVEVIDAKTLKITTKNVLPIIFYFHLTYPTAFVVDKVQVDAAPRSWTDNPNGSGPYWLEKKDVGQIVLRANELYYGAKSKIKKIVYDISGGSTLSSYENDEIDLSGVGVADIQAVRAQTAFAGEYFEGVEMSTSYIGLNTKEPPFDDVKVRQAFAMAINKEWLAKEVLVDLVRPAQGVLPPGMPGYRPDLKGLPFDPEKAKQLLAESKYGGPEGLPRIKLTISGSGSAPSVVLQSIIEMWRTNLGVEVILESIDYVTFLDHIKKGQFQMFSLGWIADYPDPEDFIDLKFHSQRSRANNETGYANSTVDKLIEQARVERDPQKRLQLYQQAEDIIIKEVPWILLFHSKTSVLAKPYIKDYFPTPMGISTVRYMYFEK